MTTSILFSGYRSKGIRINPANVVPLKGGFQEKCFLGGHFKRYRLRQNTEGVCQLESDNRLSDPQPYNAYAFVVTMNGELYLGLGSHYFVANRATEVLAAGDIYFDASNTIHEFDDRSGTYHIDAMTWNNYGQTKQALQAMEQAGLPMNRFNAFSIKSSTQQLGLG